MKRLSIRKTKSASEFEDTTNLTPEEVLEALNSGYPNVDILDGREEIVGMASKESSSDYQLVYEYHDGESYEDTDMDKREMLSQIAYLKKNHLYFSVN